MVTDRVGTRRTTKTRTATRRLARFFETFNGTLKGNLIMQILNVRLELNLVTKNDVVQNRF